MSLHVAHFRRKPMSTCPTQSFSAVRAGVYTRISSDPSGQRAGVERQRADCEAYLARGWKVTEVFCDNDASAYGTKARRAYERMLGAVESGSIDAIVTWHNDRLHRSPRELKAFIDLVERSRVHLAVVTGGDYDLTTRTGDCQRASSEPWPARSSRTGVGACGASTWSWPSWAGPPASSVGACAARKSKSSSGKPPAECSKAMAS